MNDIPRKLQFEIEAAKQLRLQVAALISYGTSPADLSPDDLAALNDTFDGETTLDQAIEKALADIDEHEAIASGLKAKEEAFKARRARCEKRIEDVYGLIEAAMLAAQWKSKRLTTGTVSIADRPPSVEIDDESQIPAQFFVRADPKLSKTELNKAVKEASKAISAADKIADASAKATAILDTIKALPPLPERDEALREASAINDPDLRLQAIQGAVARFPLVPGCHLATGGVSLKISRS